MEITIDGKRYALAFNMYAMEKIEETFGSMQEMYKGIHSGGRMTWTLVEMIRILINAQNMKEAAMSRRTFHPVSHDELAARMSFSDVMQLRSVITSALAAGMDAQMMHAENDDAEHDVVLEEIQKKENPE